MKATTTKIIMIQVHIFFFFLKNCYFHYLQLESMQLSVSVLLGQQNVCLDTSTLTWFENSWLQFCFLMSNNVILRLL